MRHRRDKPKDDLRYIKARSLKMGATWQLIGWLNQNSGAESASGKTLYREAVKILAELQAFSAYHVRQSKTAKEFSKDRMNELDRTLGRIPLGFAPSVNASIVQHGRIVARPQSNLGWSAKHPLGQPVAYMFRAWEADAIENVRQCWHCQKWYFSRPDRDTCSDRCRQIKSRKTREKE